MRLARRTSGSSLTVFDPIASKIGADPDRGSGLVGLRDRVEALGGTLEITSKPSGGTSLLAVLPVRL
jgi:signal transduction histidine kinase